MLHFQHLFFSHHCRRISWLLTLWLMLLFVSLGARAQDCPSLVESDFDISYLAGNADCNTRPAVKLAYKGHVAGFTQFYVEFSSDGLHWKNKQSFQIDRVGYIILNDFADGDVVKMRLAGQCSSSKVERPWFEVTLPTIGQKPTSDFKIMSTATPGGGCGGAAGIITVREAGVHQSGQVSYALFRKSDGEKLVDWKTRGARGDFYWDFANLAAGDYVVKAKVVPSCAIATPGAGWDADENAYIFETDVTVPKTALRTSTTPGLGTALGKVRLIPSRTDGATSITYTLTNRTGTPALHKTLVLTTMPFETVIEGIPVGDYTAKATLDCGAEATSDFTVSSLPLGTLAASVARKPYPTCAKGAIKGNISGTLPQGVSVTYTLTEGGTPIATKTGTSEVKFENLPAGNYTLTADWAGQHETQNIKLENGKLGQLSMTPMTTELSFCSPTMQMNFSLGYGDYEEDLTLDFYAEGQLIRSIDWPKDQRNFSIPGLPIANYSATLSLCGAETKSSWNFGSNRYYQVWGEEDRKNNYDPRFEYGKNSSGGYPIIREIPPNVVLEKNPFIPVVIARDDSVDYCTNEVPIEIHWLTYNVFEKTFKGGTYELYRNGVLLKTALIPNVKRLISPDVTSKYIRRNVPIYAGNFNITDFITNPYSWTNRIEATGLWYNTDASFTTIMTNGGPGDYELRIVPSCGMPTQTFKFKIRDHTPLLYRAELSKLSYSREVFPSDCAGDNAGTLVVQLRGSMREHSYQITIKRNGTVVESRVEKFKGDGQTGGYYALNIRNAAAGVYDIEIYPLCLPTLKKTFRFSTGGPFATTSVAVTSGCGNLGTIRVNQLQRTAKKFERVELYNSSNVLLDTRISDGRYSPDGFANLSPGTYTVKYAYDTYCTRYDTTMTVVVPGAFEENTLQVQDSIAVSACQLSSLRWNAPDMELAGGYTYKLEALDGSYSKIISGVESGKTAEFKDYFTPGKYRLTMNSSCGTLSKEFKVYYYSGSNNKYRTISYTWTEQKYPFVGCNNGTLSGKAKWSTCESTPLTGKVEYRLVKVQYSYVYDVNYGQRQKVHSVQTVASFVSPTMTDTFTFTNLPPLENTQQGGMQTVYNIYAYLNDVPQQDETLVNNTQVSLGTIQRDGYNLRTDDITPEKPYVGNGVVVKLSLSQGSSSYYAYPTAPVNYRLYNQQGILVAQQQVIGTQTPVTFSGLDINTSYTAVAGVVSTCGELTNRTSFGTGRPSPKIRVEMTHSGCDGGHKLKMWLENAEQMDSVRWRVGNLSQRIMTAKPNFTYEMTVNAGSYYITATAWKGDDDEFVMNSSAYFPDNYHTMNYSYSGAQSSGPNQYYTAIPPCSNKGFIPLTISSGAPSKRRVRANGVELTEFEPGKWGGNLTAGYYGLQIEDGCQSRYDNFTIYNKRGWQFYGTPGRRLAEDCSGRYEVYYSLNNAGYLPSGVYNVDEPVENFEVAIEPLGTLEADATHWEKATNNSTWHNVPFNPYAGYELFLRHKDLPTCASTKAHQTVPAATEPVEVKNNWSLDSRSNDIYHCEDETSNYYIYRNSWSRHKCKKFTFVYVNASTSPETELWRRTFSYKEFQSADQFLYQKAEINYRLDIYDEDGTLEKSLSVPVFHARTMTPNNGVYITENGSSWWGTATKSFTNCARQYMRYYFAKSQYYSNCREYGHLEIFDGPTKVLDRPMFNEYNWFPEYDFTMGKTYKFVYTSAVNPASNNTFDWTVKDIVVKNFKALQVPLPKPMDCNPMDIRERDQSVRAPRAFFVTTDPPTAYWHWNWKKVRITDGKSHVTYERQKIFSQPNEDLRGVVEESGHTDVQLFQKSRTGGPYGGGEYEKGRYAFVAGKGFNGEWTAYYPDGKVSPVNGFDLHDGTHSVELTDACGKVYNFTYQTEPDMWIDHATIDWTEDAQCDGSVRVTPSTTVTYQEHKYKAPYTVTTTKTVPIKRWSQRDRWWYETFYTPGQSIDYPSGYNWSNPHYGGGYDPGWDYHNQGGYLGPDSLYHPYYPETTVYFDFNDGEKTCEKSLRVEGFYRRAGWPTLFSIDDYNTTSFFCDQDKKGYAYVFVRGGMAPYTVSMNGQTQTATDNTPASFVITPANEGQTLDYTVTDKCGQYTLRGTLTLYSFAEMGRKIKAKQEICEGETVKLSVPYYHNGTYKWRRPNGTYANTREIDVFGNAAGAGKYQITITIPPCGGQLYREIMVSLSKVNETAVHKEITLCAGERAKIDLPAATVTSGGTTTTPRYSWEYSYDKANWQTIASANGEDLDYVPTNAGTLYIRRKSSSDRCAGYSAISTLNVTPGFVQNISTDELTLTLKGKNPYTVTAGVLTGSGTRTYKWYRSTDKNTWTEVGNEATYRETNRPKGKRVLYYYRTVDGGGCHVESPIITVYLKGGHAARVNPHLRLRVSQ